MVPSAGAGRVQDLWWVMSLGPVSVGQYGLFFSPNQLQIGLRSGINCPHEARPLDYNRSMKNPEPFIEGHLGLELCILAPLSWLRDFRRYCELGLEK